MGHRRGEGGGYMLLQNPYLFSKREKGVRGVKNVLKTVHMFYEWPPVPYG